MTDLKLVYRAASKDAAENALDALEEKWGDTYPIVIKSWRKNGHSYRPISNTQYPYGASSIPPMPLKLLIVNFTNSQRPKGPFRMKIAC